MDPSALESVSRSLESSLDFWGWLILASTGVVVLGLVIEYWEPVHEFIEEWRRPAAAFPWRKFWGLAGGILVTAGVAGEFGFTYEASRVETNLRANNHEIEILLNQGTSGALQKAAEANARATANDLAAQQLKAENLRLEAIIAPRSLSLEQQRKIADACRKFHGHGVLVKSYGTDGEGAALAGQIIATLKSADIVVADSRGSEIVAGGFDSGVHVRAPGAELAFAGAIADALSTIGKLKVSPVNDPEPRTGAVMGGGGQSFTDPKAVFVTVRVGIKPLPVLSTTSNAAANAK
jgi:hypothetical protein